MRSLLFCSALLLGAFSFGQSFATARVMESSLKKLTFIQIAYESGESENIPLEDWALMSTGGSIAATMGRNQMATNQMLANMEKKGYALLSTNLSVSGSYLMTLFVFRKQE